MHDHLDSLDLTRIFSADHASASGMARSENQAFHRQRFREAVAAIGKIGSHVLDSAVCREVSLELILLREETGRPFAAPPAVPADRLAGRPRLFCSHTDGLAGHVRLEPANVILKKALNIGANYDWIWEHFGTRDF